MHKIEQAMLAAIRDGQELSQGNTVVHHDPVIDGVEVEVWLHGNLIAKRYRTDHDGRWEINLCGWNTRTTRSRLTAICREFVPGCHGVSTARGVVRLVYADHYTVIGRTGSFNAADGRHA